MEPKLFGEAQQAVRRRDRAMAYRLLRQVLFDNPTFVPAWISLSKVVDDPQQQQECLERALRLEPANQGAQEGLEQLRIRELLATIAAFANAPSPPRTRKLGEYLFELEVLTATQIQDALAEQRARARQGQHIRLGELLLQRGLLTPEALARALVRQQELRQKTLSEPFSRLGEYLVAEQLITADQLEAALAEQLRLRQQGEQLLLGQILVRMHCLTREILEQILERQRAEFFGAFAD